MFTERELHYLDEHNPDSMGTQSAHSVEKPSYLVHLVVSEGECASQHNRSIHTHLPFPVTRTQ
jgi:hypothetical protein